MLIANQKKSENIVEYLIYMHNIEDIVRKYGCDQDRILEEYVSKVVPNPSFLPQYEDWYTQLCIELKNAGKTSKGHINEVEEVTLELVYLHQSLIAVSNDEKYIALFEKASDDIEEFRNKSNQPHAHPIDLAIYAMNMKLQLKIRGKEISDASERAFDNIRILLAYLSNEYNKMKRGNWEFNPN